MLIGILQTGHAPDALRPSHGDYPDLFQRLLRDRDLDFRTWAVVDGEFPQGPHAAEGWLITGSRHGAYEDHPWIPPLEQLIRDIHAANVPLVGVCFGHQIVAQALGGRVEKFPGGWSVGRTEYDWNGERLALNAWHQDQVTQRPEGATVLASSPFCENAALLYGDRILTVQAHPEFPNGFVAEMIEKRGRGLVPDPLLDAAKASLDAPLDDARLADRIARFFHERTAA
ncbi:type 1 glutamine amidotransferase [Rubellimicrobium aerolatum]|uniref:Type 1 glutamine amidotransferase n=1 Tax=Rubellimicrobium aerolatum TaxID=490979 RepID=A0ABW0S8X0_9RHOB|nr:type 1 glutamine amidotransferase [Rubellimicrobium aerolatum]MBP1804743.1 GMP synthase-like glutamine amidotransferase [Rubellimicrobium aerolatum]